MKVILNIFVQLKAVYDLQSRLLPNHSHAKCKSHIIYSYLSILVSDISVLKSNMNKLHALIFLIKKFVWAIAMLPGFSRTSEELYLFRISRKKKGKKLKLKYRFLE